ncbi:MAG TPA: DNRLRE domain-containing protein [Polyangiaceae bacterium]|nr:DNRLRE domain-containing protein [Polyangiaceae bacterium]
MKLNRVLPLLVLGLSGCARHNAEPRATLALQRIVSTPSSIAFVSSDRATPGLGGEIRFGGPLGRSALYLKFPSELRTRGVPRQAFLTLSPREASAISASPVTLEAWRINADWQASGLQHWFEKPSLAPPFARTHITSSPPRELRIDVTELVRFAAENPERDFGIAVIASGSDGPAANFDSGLAGGTAPRLELYLP